MTTTALRRACLLLVALCLLSSATLSAQFGGLKKKATKAAGLDPTSPAKPAAATPAPEVTPVIVDHYLAGLKARHEERDRIAKGNTPAGKYYAAVDAQRAHDKRCEDFNQNKTATYSRLIKEQKYDSAATVIQIRDTTCEQGSTTPQEPEWEELNKAKGQQDTVAATAAGLEVSQWAQLDEWIPLMVNQMVQSPDQNNQALASNFGKKVSEAESIRARQADLAKALGIKGREKKSAPVEVAVPVPAPAAAAGAQPQGDYNCFHDEMAKSQDAMSAMSDRAEAAKKKNDTKTVMAIADSISALNIAAMRKCGMTQ
jgi:hypothetical protein